MTADAHRLVVVGNSWLGRAIASPNEPVVSFRELHDLPNANCVVIAGGLNNISPDSDEAATISHHLYLIERHLRAASEAGASSAVVIGSSDVCGIAPLISGETDAHPITAYGRLKASVENFCLRQEVLPTTVVRMAPVHGAGKAQTRRLLDIARSRFIVTPSKRTSTGFVTLADAVMATRALALDSSPDRNRVMSVGAGKLSLYELLAELHDRLSATKQTRIPLRFPSALARLAACSSASKISWLGRLFLPRTVLMEASCTPMSVSEAAEYLVSTCAPAGTSGSAH